LYRRRMGDSLESAMVSRICPDATVEQAAGMFGRIQEAINERLDRMKGADGGNMMITKYRCDNCKNTDQSAFLEDYKHGQVTCTNCGMVIEDRKIHDGEWKRQFSGEENPSQHGPTPDPRFSSSHNLRTNMNAGAGRGAGSNVTKKQLLDLKKVQDKIEMDLSNMKEDGTVKRTREGYKDQQKRTVFVMLDETSQSLQLHEQVVQKAQSHFADYRNKHETVQQRDLIAAGCLLMAYRELVAKGEEVMKRLNGVKRKRENPSQAVSSYEDLHPFPCHRCATRFSTKKDLRLHSRQCTIPLPVKEER